jgi:hypothetical protein
MWQYVAALDSVFVMFDEMMTVRVDRMMTMTTIESTMDTAFVMSIQHPYRIRQPTGPTMTNVSNDSSSAMVHTNGSH